MLAICLLVLSQTVSAQFSSQLQVYPTRYYDIYTDVDEPIVREAALRMTRMAEAYHERTKTFAGSIVSKLPLYIYRHETDYLAAGGLQGSSGVYTGNKLMAYVGARSLNQLWRALQHEGFHQFADVVIGGDMPVWVDEGLAEYFEQAVFTGDGMVAGLVPGVRLTRIKENFVKHAFMDVTDFMHVSRKDWNDQLSRVNYDQAWSLVHFLAHAYQGKYRVRFDQFMRDISRMGADQAWEANFGSNTKAFASRWNQYWMKLPKRHTADLYIEITVATLTSFLARSVLQSVSFKDAEDFLVTVNAHTLPMDNENWLPPMMLERALQHARTLKPWTLTLHAHTGGTLSMPFQFQIISGEFEIADNKIKSVTIKRTRR